MDASDPRQKKLDAWLALAHEGPVGSGPLALPMLSGSMLPAIPVGSTLIITPGDGRRCLRGDLVVFAAGDRLVAHRVLLRLKLPGMDFILEKGDNNPRGRWLRTNRVKGKVTGVILPGQEARRDPADAGEAGRSLRRHLRDLLFRRPGPSENEP